MKCPKCETELIWGGDNDYEDYGMEGEGVVSNSSCVNDECDVETVMLCYTNDNQNTLKSTKTLKH